MYGHDKKNVFNNAHPGSWSVYAEFRPFWFKSLAVMPRHTHIHTYKPKYILKCAHGSNSFGPSVMKKFSFFFCALFHFTYQWEEV